MSEFVNALRSLRDRLIEPEQPDCADEYVPQPPDDHHGRVFGSIIPFRLG